MAVRQYIGARYVPKFLGTYDATTQYEALSVVDNGLGTSYISKKPVPIGTPLTDNEYWAVYGASSGAILDLQNRMDSAESDITDIQGDLGTAQSDISDLQSDMATAESDIKKRNQRNIICIGDSYAQWTEGVGISWISYVRDHFANRNLFYHNEAGGSGFLAGLYGPGTYKSFQELLEEVAATISADDKLKITDIIVCGGYNDFSAGHAYISQLSSKVRDFKVYADSTFPNAQIYMGMIGRSTTKSTALSLLEETFPYYYRAAIAHGCTYLSNIENVLKNDDQMQSDGMHPNSSGSTALGQALIQLLKGETYLKITKQTSTVSDSNGTYNMGLTLLTNENGITISSPVAAYTFTTPTEYTLQPGTVLTLGTLNTTFGHVFENIYEHIKVQMRASDNTFLVAEGALYIDDRTLKLNLYNVTGWQWSVITISTITLGPWSIHIPKNFY